MADHTKPSADTRAEEAHEAREGHGPDRAPTAEEAALADDNAPNPETAAHEREMDERGAHQQGEGRLP